MRPLTFLVIAGDPSGDLAAAELVRALREATGPTTPRFFGAGGPAMASVGVEILVDLTRHSVIGLEILKRFRVFRDAFRDLLAKAEEELPDAVIGVDYSGFNLRFAAALRRRITRREGRPFHNWRPLIVQYIAPQVWASRPKRALGMQRSHDLLLSILPFEKAWFGQHAPQVEVEFVGHPLVDRHLSGPSMKEPVPPMDSAAKTLLLLPGSRPGELQRHLPVMIPAAAQIAERTGASLDLVLPAERLVPHLLPWLPAVPKLRWRVGGLDEALSQATVAMASTGTVTLECAWFGVPTVALYKTSALTYHVAKRLIQVKYLAMPNLLAGEALMPELVQSAATPEALTAEAVALLEDLPRRSQIRVRLQEIARSLGEPGASHRAALAILKRLTSP